MHRDDIKYLSVTKIGLSTRACNVLCRYQIYIVKDLLTLTEENLLDMYQIGNTTVREIMDKIAECSALMEVDSEEFSLKSIPATSATEAEASLHYDQWLAEPENQQRVTAYLKDANIGIDALEYLSPKAYNLLSFAGYTHLYQIIFLTEEQLSAISRIDSASVRTIKQNCRSYLRENKEVILSNFIPKQAEPQESFLEHLTIWDMLELPNARKKIFLYAKTHDLSLEQMKLSVRSCNALKRAGYYNISDILFMQSEDFYALQNLGKRSVEEILEKVKDYFTQHQDNILAFLNGEDTLPMEAMQATETTGEDAVTVKAILDRAIQAEAVPAEATQTGAETPQQSAPIHEAIKDAGTRELILGYVRENDIPLEGLKLSARSYNALRRAGYHNISDIVFMQSEELLAVNHLGKTSVKEILEKINHYFARHQANILALLRGEDPAPVEAIQAEAETSQDESLSCDVVNTPTLRELILAYVRKNDIPLDGLKLSVRSHNALRRAGYHNISDIIFMQSEDFYALQNLGKLSVEEILEKINQYFAQHQTNIQALTNSQHLAAVEAIAEVSQDSVRRKLLKVYDGLGFDGLRFSEIIQKLELPKEADIAIVKKTIGRMIADGELLYMDYLIYRAYPSFLTFLEEHNDGTDKKFRLLQERMQGETLEAIAQRENVTRERIRQIVKKAIQACVKQKQYTAGNRWFDEDYYEYLYTNYALDRQTCTQWLGIPAETYRYLELFYTAGEGRPLQNALYDSMLDVCIKLKIRNFLNRNTIMVDGIRIPLKRSALEAFVLQKYCQDQVTIEAFAELYNEFLEEQGIPLSSDLYCTAAHLHSRANKFATTSRIVLYTPSRHLRYYDIDAKDYTKLLDKLNLWSYRDVELSTAKFMRQHPKLMAQYDIRNQYELHNLLKKIIPEGSYYDFHCKRSPTIAFGNFDRDEMILNLLINHAPITTADLIDLIHKEYGDSKDQIHNKYLQNFQQYHHNGVYTIDKKAMPSAHMELLRAALTEDFYFFYEIKRIYRELIPDADPEMVNPYTLKSMGLLVLSDYVLQNHASLDAYFKHLMTKSDIVELAPLKKRFGSITMWHGALFSMKQNYQIIEFEPDRSISLQKLERSGVTKQMLTDFCDEVYRYVESDTYFTVKSLNQCGFTAPLYELGFQEWFYANILCQDARFSSQKTLGTIVLFKGNTEVSIRSFVIDQIRRKGMIDVIDLLNLLQEFFGCNAATVHIIKEKIRDTEIFYDPILDRLYANAELYYKELEEDAEEL